MTGARRSLKGAGATPSWAWIWALDHGRRTKKGERAPLVRVSFGVVQVKWMLRGGPPRRLDQSTMYKACDSSQLLVRSEGPTKHGRWTAAIVSIATRRGHAIHCQFKRLDFD